MERTTTGAIRVKPHDDFTALHFIKARICMSDYIAIVIPV
jgi:hypothetical protein